MAEILEVKQPGWKGMESCTVIGNFFMEAKIPFYASFLPEILYPLFSTLYNLYFLPLILSLFILDHFLLDKGIRIAQNQNLKGSKLTVR